MHHKMSVRLDPETPLRPFYASCSCGPRGNFRTREESLQYLDSHMNNIAVGVNTGEFSDETLVAPATYVAAAAETVEEAPAEAAPVEQVATRRPARSREEDGST